MKREYRYMVAKYKDMLAYLTDEEQSVLLGLHRKIHVGREAGGKRILECVCVEDDWPEYEKVWAMIAARVDDLPLYKATIQQANEYPEAIALRSQPAQKGPAQ